MDEKELSSTTYQSAVIDKRWLSNRVFELALIKPAGFDFLPGQKVNVYIAGMAREYTIVSAPGEEYLALCIRHLVEGKVSSRLAALQLGDVVAFSTAYGYFLHRPGSSIFVATGTGVAPCVAFARSGIRDFILLHGVAATSELYYRHLFLKTARHYVGCLSPVDEDANVEGNIFAGRVTDYLRQELAPGQYTFYLCGNGEMVADAMKIIDSRFERSRVFMESFFNDNDR
ncbi:MAG TPA: FAD-binding oxidoreductase [Desulfopila sp.]|nr:FAD-binding oxidoreductase [Desulfopila sp.]